MSKESKKKPRGARCLLRCVTVYNGRHSRRRQIPCPKTTYGLRANGPTEPCNERGERPYPATGATVTSTEVRLQDSRAHIFWRSDVPGTGSVFGYLQLVTAWRLLLKKNPPSLILLNPLEYICVFMSQERLVILCFFHWRIWKNKE